MVQTTKEDGARVLRFMERSEKQWQEMAKVLSALHLKYDQLSKEVQRLQANSSDGHSVAAHILSPCPPHYEQNPPPHQEQPILSCTLRLEFPRYDGGEPSSWLYRAEQFFDYHQTPPPQQVQIASFHLQGEALQWFRWISTTFPLSNWTEFA